MKINHIKKGSLEYIFIEDLYNDNQLKVIKKEIKTLIPFAVSPNSETIGAATDENGEILKNNKSLWVDNIYSTNRDASSILKYNRIIFDFKLIQTFKSYNAYFGHLEKSNYDTTMLNYYTNEQQYKPHTDMSLVTVLTFFKIGDFTGGELVFPDHKEVIPFKENSMVVFPGCILHESKPIKTKDKKSYRISMAQFINYKII
jgi:hypothetical protein